MSKPTSLPITVFSALALSLFFASSLMAQQLSNALATAQPDSPFIKVSIDSEPPPMPLSSKAIIAAFLKSETETREALNQHTFKRDVVLQTVGPNGQVTGEYIRNSQFLFDDRGNRIERVLYHPSSTIREMRITKEDIQDLAGAQLLGVDIAETGKYRLSYLGTELLDLRTAFTTVMSLIRSSDGFTGPTRCDVAQVRRVYEHVRMHAAEVKKRQSQQVVKIVPVDAGEEPVDDDTPIVLKKP